MDIGVVGLGRMGANMARRLAGGNHRVVVYDRDPKQIRAVAAEGAATLRELAAKLKAPRVIWVMVPSGDITGKVIAELSTILDKHDVLVDGGNSLYKDSLCRARELKEKGIYFVDAGTSGGIWGLEKGYCLMVGGDREAFRLVEPALKTLAPKDGYLHVGPAGAGHFVKMIHNGIEYGMMQAYAEGFALLKAAPFDVDLPAVAHLWNQGSVVRSWLLELAHRALKKDPQLASLRGYVEDSGEGRWTVNQAVESAVPAPVITAALFERFRSRITDGFGDRLLAALRNEFGGHATKK
jgi:6-phosphogluconate dehydrogenase